MIIVGFHAWFKLMANRGSRMTLLKYIARLMLPPFALKAAKSLARVASDLSTTGPLTNGSFFKSSEEMWHHRQQCLPMRVWAELDHEVY